MPCEYTTINLRERQRQEQEQAAQKGKEAVAEKKRSLFLALQTLGFEVSVSTIDADKTFIIGTRGD